MVAWCSPGDILRWWRRDIAGLTQQEAAARFNVQASSLSKWERGSRSISIDPHQLDTALGGGGAVVDLMWAQPTPEGLDPGHLWTKVFPAEATAVWLWIRSSASTVVVEAEWGVARIDLPIDLGPNGAFVTVGTCVPDSPVVVLLSEPGWADFGFGELPAEIPGAPVFAAVNFFRASTADGTFMKLFRSSLASRLSDGSPGPVPSSVVEFAAGDGAGAPPPKRWPPHPEGIDAIERERFARLRKARGLSLVDLAERLADRTDILVSRDTLRRFEDDVGTPHHPMLPIALDHVLGAEGRLAAIEVKSGSGSSAVTLPPYWRGPVWLTFEGPSDGRLVVLRRGHWHRSVTVSGSETLSAHWFDPSVPVRIEADRSVSWAVGLGRRPDAESIDQNWTPTTVDTAQGALAATEEALFTAIDRSNPEDPERSGEAS